MMSDLMSEEVDVDLLVSSIEKRPVLWDKTIDVYKHRVATQTAWREIMLIVKSSSQRYDESKKELYVKMILNKWTHIRDNYLRSIRKIEAMRRAGSKKIIKPYIYSKQLRFLRKVFKSNDPPNDSKADDDNTKTDNLEENSEINDRSESNSEDNNYNTIDNHVAKRCTPKRTVDHELNLSNAKKTKFSEAYTQEPQPTNRHLSFFNGILPTLNNFDDDEVLEFQMGVVQLLRNIKSNRQQLTHFINVPSCSHNNSGYSNEHCQSKLKPMQASSPRSVKTFYSDSSD